MLIPPKVHAYMKELITYCYRKNQNALSLQIVAATSTSQANCQQHTLENQNLENKAVTTTININDRPGDIGGKNAVP